MRMGMLGTMEIAVVLVVILMVFGPTKLPALGEGVGKMLRGFKREIREGEEPAAQEPGSGGPG